MAVMKRSALGRGLDALITMDDLKTGGSSSISEIELSKIQPNPDQPRSIFEEETLEELATSIRSLGVIQPITLKEIGTEKYMIISGERRYRASLMAGLEQIPAYIKTAADENVVEMALIENIQREDLNSIEIALAYQKLIDSYGLTQEKLSERVGKKRATIANYLRLLKLPAEIQMGLKDKKIDMGHARALLPVEDPEVQLALYEQILAEGLSVRNVEEIVRNGAEAVATEKKEKTAGRKPMLPEEFNLLKAGFNNVDLEAAKGKLPVVRVPAYSPYAVAEYSLALMLSLNRKIHRAYWRTRDGNFSLNGLMGFDMHGKTVGIIGTGKIAKILIRILKGLGMHILAYDVYPDYKFAEEEGITYTTLDELYKSSDIISLHSPLTEQTRYIINDDSIAKMKDGVMIINTGQ